MTGARIFWRTDWDASVVATEASPARPGDPDAFDVGQFDDVVTLLHHADGHQSLLLSDGVHHLQFEIVAGSVTSGPVRLHYRLSGFRLVEVQTLTVRRLAQFCRLGRFPLGLFPPEPRAHRWIMALRAYDGVRGGASHRDIAIALFGKQRVRDDWSGRSDYLRLRVQRLAHSGSALVQGGYRELLRGGGTGGMAGVEPHERRRGAGRR
ncbi:DUF2285 domain-containing protein [Telmatospirillum sp.]|uniref:DUF2285 domain-containing protein n=1 Tax=Telmatospirillum sp. TaxID=2079197 RepID=UPI0028485FAE|nr:DUF2285 domain-containing protein [Telmatospirillum sp.]MDR3439915.1 DUF2285 domain-containing protein [Telmatospirillum sp.]